MAKVRVYELAKELNIDSKEIITFLGGKNISVKTMSGLEDSYVELVKNNYAKKETKTITKSESEMHHNEEKQTERPKKKPVSRQFLIHSTASRA